VSNAPLKSAVWAERAMRLLLWSRRTRDIVMVMVLEDRFIGFEALAMLMYPDTNRAMF
jgi:hypothetical protein